MYEERSNLGVSEMVQSTVFLSELEIEMNHTCDKYLIPGLANRGVALLGSGHIE